MRVRSASWRCSTSASAPVSAASASGPRRRSAPGTLQSASCGDACASSAALVHFATKNSFALHVRRYGKARCLQKLAAHASSAQ